MAEHRIWYLHVPDSPVELMNAPLQYPPPAMIIGIDFDNTIIDYDDLFYRAGLSLGVLPESASRDKRILRTMLVDRGMEDDWIRIQGLVYGKFIRAAQVMEGFPSFADLCRHNDWKIFIISHKTRDTVMGERFDLHDAALKWLKDNGIYGKGIQNAVSGVFFESTREEKIARINRLGCTIIIDDLVEVLRHPDLAGGILKILYNTRAENTAGPGYLTATGWDQVCGLIMRHYE